MRKQGNKGLLSLISYRYCGLPVQSNIPIPELPRFDTKERGIIFKIRHARPPAEDHVWSQHWFSSTGEGILSYCHQDNFHYLRFPGLADFQISPFSTQIICDPIPKIPRETIRHLLLDHVIPRCFAYQGKLMVHASAVRYEHYLILFVGDSGTGKSTLAGKFHLAGQSIVADDCLWIKGGRESVKAISTYRGLRLWSDSLDVLFPSDQKFDLMAHYSSKRRISLSEDDLLEHKDGLPILAVFVLSQADVFQDSDFSLEKLSSRESFIALMKQSFQLDVQDFNRIRELMSKLGHIVSKLRVYRLKMPYNYDLLSQVHKRILETVSNSSM